MIKSKLPNNVLGKIWKLSDVDKDGMLDADEKYFKVWWFRRCSAFFSGIPYFV